MKKNGTQGNKVSLIKKKITSFRMVLVLQEIALRVILRKNNSVFNEICACIDLPWFPFYVLLKTKNKILSEVINILEIFMYKAKFIKNIFTLVLLECSLRNTSL